MEGGTKDDDTPGELRSPIRTSGGESAGQPQPKLTISDARTFLKAVKETFQDNKGKYVDFLKVLNDLKAKRLHLLSVIARVKELFHGHNELILGFNNFLPKAFEIILPDDKQKLRAAVNFINKVLTRFQDEIHKYKSFLDIMQLHGTEGKSKSEIYQEVSVLFRGHDDLLVELVRYLAESSATA